RTPLGRRASISGCGRAGTRVWRIPQTSYRMRRPGAPFKLRMGGTFYRWFRTDAAAPGALSPHSMFVLLPLARPGIILCAIIFHAWWRDGRLARLAGGAAHRSIDVANG